MRRQRIEKTQLGNSSVIGGFLLSVLLVSGAGMGAPGGRRGVKEQQPPAQSPAGQVQQPQGPAASLEPLPSEWKEKLAPANETKTAGEYYKNLQILKELPAPRLAGMMKYFSWSLGVRCVHCHVVGEWSKDDKPEKQTARKMINMAAAIDKEYFPEKQGPTCWTCHRGEVKPEFDPPERPRPEPQPPAHQPPVAPPGAP
jgi:hypothetical protein